MKFALPKLRTLAGGIAVAGLMAGCTLSENKAPPPADPIHRPPPANTSTVSGFAWDPEAFLFQFFMCNPPPPAPAQCTVPGPNGTEINVAPPIIVPGVPISDRVMMAGAIGAVFDPTQAGPPPANPFIAQSTTPTPQSGGFNFSKIVRRGSSPMDPPLFVAAFPPAPGSDPLFRGGPPVIPQVPPFPDVSTLAYLPTLTLKPINTSNGTCLDQGAAVMSNSGILEAVVDFLNFTHQTTGLTVPDLIDPSKYGGVGVVSLTQPLGPPTYVPTFCTPDSSDPHLCAKGVTITATQGGTTLDPSHVFNINWAPPGVGPPFQSTRGFFVDTSSQYSPMGITVVLTDAVQGPPVPVQLAYTDDQPGDGHPWMFPPLPPLPLGPQIISFVNVPGLVPNSPAPPSWVCLPPGP
jgi:hypothetical protein